MSISSELNEVMQGDKIKFHHPKHGDLSGTVVTSPSSYGPYKGSVVRVKHNHGEDWVDLKTKQVSN